VGGLVRSGTGRAVSYYILLVTSRRTQRINDGSSVEALWLRGGCTQVSRKFRAFITEAWLRLHHFALPQDILFRSDEEYGSRDLGRTQYSGVARSE
jgi:hypothetical protein